MHQMMMQAAPAALPTRVNKACDRCRKNKSRCDAYRPCSLCQRASAVCHTTDTRGGGGGAGRAVKSSAPHDPSLSAAPATYPNKRKRQHSPRSEMHDSTGSHHHVLQQQQAQDRLQRQQSRNSQSSYGSPDFRDVNGETTISIARKINTLQRQPNIEYAVDAIPGANDSPSARPATQISSTASFLTYSLPDSDIFDQLLDEYFDSVHWFSLVVLEPKFRVAVIAIRSGNASAAEKPFLLLLSTMFGLAAWYKSHKIQNTSDPASQSWLTLSQQMICNAESQIVDVMDQRSITAIQTLILLGSYYVYHGRPNLSFSLLGATIKAAQSIGLHQAASRAPELDREERRRVWWTLYTWDRFASINYGRPLGISEKVCSIEQPEDMDEEPYFSDSYGDREHQPICYTPYQRELNKLYQIASPAIERVYRAPTDDHLKTAEQYLALVNDVTSRLFRWRDSLPAHLRLDTDNDWPATLATQAKAHHLQSLSLYLTFDSLILILHRPFMKQRLDSVLSEGSPNVFDDVQSHAETEPASESGVLSQPIRTGPASKDSSSHEQLWFAAARTAKVTELPQMAQHATDGHLITFLAINLFNAAVVLIVMALSNPLSDRAQEAKRAVARIYRLQVTLGHRAVLSHQSAEVLRSLIELLIARESDALLAPVMNTVQQSSQTGQSCSTHCIGSENISVHDALSLPLWTGLISHDETEMIQRARQEPDSRTRLQHGLESVQRAFTGATHDSGLHGSGLNSQRNSRAATVGRQGIEVNTSRSNYSSATDLDFATSAIEFGVDENGMHWIWDPIWDNLFDPI